MNSSRGDITRLALLWLSGLCMRVTIMVVPPIVQALHVDLQLTQTDVGILSGLPAVLFAAAAIPGALLVARMGAERTLLAGLFIATFGSALRGAVIGRVDLFAATALMGVGLSSWGKLALGARAVVDSGGPRRDCRAAVRTRRP